MWSLGEEVAPRAVGEVFGRVVEGAERFGALLELYDDGTQKFEFTVNRRWFARMQQALHS